MQISLHVTFTDHPLLFSFRRSHWWGISRVHPAKCLQVKFIKPCMHSLLCILPRFTRRRFYFRASLWEASLVDMVLTAGNQNLEGPYCHWSTSSILKMMKLEVRNQSKTSQPFLRSHKLRVEPRNSGLPNGASLSVSDCLYVDQICWIDLLPQPLLGWWMHVLKHG